MAQARIDLGDQLPEADLFEERQAEIATLNAELAEAHDKINNLTIALESSRTIGTAIGILMAQRRIPRDDAFRVLVENSQRSHRKLRDVAEWFVYTGSLTGN